MSTPTGSPPVPCPKVSPTTFPPPGPYTFTPTSNPQSILHKLIPICIPHSVLPRRAPRRLDSIATRLPSIIERCAQARDYTTISISQIDDFVAALALSEQTRDEIIARSEDLAATDVSLLHYASTSQQSFPLIQLGVCSIPQPIQWSSH